MAGAVCAVSFLFSVLVCGFPEKLLIYGGAGNNCLFSFPFAQLSDTCDPHAGILVMYVVVV